MAASGQGARGHVARGRGGGARAGAAEDHARPDDGENASEAAPPQARHEEAEARDDAKDHDGDRDAARLVDLGQVVWVVVAAPVCAGEWR